ncbi:hypothetical protein KO528_15710 [Saccharophagus degradans]|uniref:hypothetical protein n=1 Tax=Saccharophagus degradans TaxID=86304 RepID=UPI001C09983E|nr:hypothetical protein [Saccharophagus degradans]MBU2986811.1 hypothetical protein [Saccharophagus degradans]
MNENSLIIKVLNFATKRIEFTFAELCDATNPDEVEKKQLKKLIHYKEILFHDHSDFINKVDETNEIKLFASAEDHFRLLEFQELKEARKSSVVATRFATAALVVSIISTLASIGFSLASMKSDINVPEKLYSILDNRFKDIDCILSYIAKEQKSQDSAFKTHTILKTISKDVSVISENTSSKSIQTTTKAAAD